ncbi:MAG TPA: dipeptide epimerase [Planctomycetota bacterium]|nr:dipeptide epimerase [Planctomycetota bacterium]
MKLTAHPVTLAASHGMFRIARAEITSIENVVIEIEHDGVVGIGEAAPSIYYFGETAETVVKTVAAAGEIVGDDPFLIEDVTARLREAFPEAPAAVCGIDLALHDLVGKLLDVPLYRLLGLNPDRTPVTSFTIGIETPEVMAERAAAVTDFKVLKIKIGTRHDDAILSAIRDVTDLPLRVDANIGWTKEEAVENINRIARYDIQFVEQPVVPGDNAALRWIRERVSLPIMSDESSLTLADLPGLVGCVDLVNVKLMKCGGIREALRMIGFAHAHGMGVMLGCMLETSIAITAAAHLSPLVEYADLDGNYLIANDPYEGVTLGDGRLILPDRPGLGVRERGGT